MNNDDYKFVLGILNKYFKNYKNKEDLFQVGCIGLIEAYKKYNPNLNTKFTTYAFSYVVGEMKKLIRDDNSIKINRNIQLLKNKIEKCYGLLCQKYKRIPTTLELAKYLNIDELLVIDVLNSTNCVSSLDNDTDFSLYEVIGDECNLDDKLNFDNMLDNLSEFERTLINFRYVDDLTQSEVAKNLGITQVQVSRYEKKILMKLKDNLVKL